MALALNLWVDGLYWWQECGQALIFFTLISLMVKLSIFYALELYCRYRRYAGVCSTPAGWRVLVLGAGEAGTLVVQEIEANPRLGLKPVAFADDEPARLGAQIEALFRPLWPVTDDNLWEKETWLPV